MRFNKHGYWDDKAMSRALAEWNRLARKEEIRHDKAMERLLNLTKAEEKKHDERLRTIREESRRRCDALVTLHDKAPRNSSAQHENMLL